LDATGCRSNFFSTLKQNACLGFLVDELNALAAPGHRHSDNETLLWWCNKVVTSERQQCAGWTSYCVTCQMLYVILVGNVAYGAGFSALECRSCEGAHGKKCGSVDRICGQTEFVRWFSRNVLGNAHGMSRMLLLHFC